MFQQCTGEERGPLCCAGQHAGTLLPEGGGEQGHPPWEGLCPFRRLSWSLVALWAGKTRFLPPRKRVPPPPPLPVLPPVVTLTVRQGEGLRTPTASVVRVAEVEGHHFLGGSFSHDVPIRSLTGRSSSYRFPPGTFCPLAWCRGRPCSLGSLGLKFWERHTRRLPYRVGAAGVTTAPPDPGVGPPGQEDIHPSPRTLSLQSQASRGSLQAPGHGWKSL